MAEKGPFPFQPEAHDIGKLIHLEGTELSGIIRANNHIFIDPNKKLLDFEGHGLTPPDRRDLTWLAALLHHREGGKRAEECTDLNKNSDLSFEERSTIFLMVIADHMASATSRTISDKAKGGLIRSRKERGQYAYEEHGRELLKLWNRSWKPPIAVGVRTKEELQNRLLDYLRHEAAEIRFLDRFQQDLKGLPEDKFPLMNMTSLYTHCELVGKIYRVLARHVDRIPDKGENKENKGLLSLDGDKARTVNEAQGKWALTFVRCEIVSPHQPVRVGDLNIGRLRNDIIQSLERSPDIGDHLLLHTAETLWLLFPGKDQEAIALRLRDCLAPFCNLGFYAANLSFDSTIKDIQNIDPGFHLRSKAVEKKVIKVYFGSIHNDQVSSEAGKEIEPPLCEICQMAGGKEVLHREDDDRQVTDYLCDSCLSTRTSGERFRKLSDWGKENSQVAWVKVLLDKSLMEEAVRELYFKHADERFDPEDAREIKENFRNLGLLSDFVQGYFSFVRRFADEVFSQLGGKRNESEAGYSDVELLDDEHREFFVLRLGEVKTAGRLLKIFVDFLRSSATGFPDCAHKSPIKLRVSVSKAKYPFYEHWNFLKEESGFIQAQVPSKARLELSLEEYDHLIERDLESGFARSLLHRLVRIEALTHSSLLVRAELAPEPRDRREHREFKEWFRRMDGSGALRLNKVLAYAKILEI